MRRFWHDRDAIRLTRREQLERQAMTPEEHATRAWLRWPEQRLGPRPSVLSSLAEERNFEIVRSARRPGEES